MAVGWARITRMVTTVRLGHGDAPVLTELSRELDETVDLSILTGTGTSGPGRAAAAAAGRERGGVRCCTAAPTARRAAGRARAWRQARARCRVDVRLLTANTITDRAALNELTASGDGVAYDREEQTEGICAVGGCYGGVG